MDTPDNPHIKGIGIIMALPVIATFGIAACWTSFLLGGGVQATQEPCYVVFQRTFPIPDGATTVAAAVAAWVSHSDVCWRSKT